ncbi:MAG TPA: hypothetical protein P5163_02785 [Rubrivivax sp.]|nr:hypothetical protein [Pseudomonadota bacterium]HOW46306.1 hypothetical protein [Rubrivivax sp.]HRY86270.1 hypothetical protein [Rubrivivax sp.]HRZ59491.1 hypothetical protein [Rubrivivax sp.]
MVVDFACKESGCGTRVAYVPQKTPGTAGGNLLRQADKPQASATVGVYLVCPNGHVHRYEVPADRQDG